MNGFCCDALKDISNTYAYPFYRPMIINSVTRALELGTWSLKLLSKTPNGNISKTRGATVFLNYCPFCGKQLREMNDAQKKIISIDFDGCLSTYTSGWQGADVIPDPPVEDIFLTGMNAIEWLESLCRDERFDVQIYSSRNHQEGGIFAMSHWLLDWGFAPRLLNRIRFPMFKPSAHLTIDDRAFCFQGEFPTLDEIANFKPWWKE